MALALQQQLHFWHGYRSRRWSAGAAAGGLQHVQLRPPWTDSNTQGTTEQWCLRRKVDQLGLRKQLLGMINVSGAGIDGRTGVTCSWQDAATSSPSLPAWSPPLPDRPPSHSTAMFFSQPFFHHPRVGGTFGTFLT